LTQCRLALELDSANIKALYRRGLAFLATDEFQKAKADLLRAYDVEPQNKEVLRGLKSLKEKMEQYKNRTKEVSVAMVDAPTAGAANSAQAPNGSPQPDDKPRVAEVEGKSTTSDPPSGGDAKPVIKPSTESDRAGSKTPSAKRAPFNGYDDQWREEVGVVKPPVSIDEPKPPAPEAPAGPTETVQQDGLRRRKGRSHFEDHGEEDGEDLKPSGPDPMDMKMRLVGCAALFFAVMACGTGAYIAAHLS
jgi:hypothetical protein